MFVVVYNCHVITIFIWSIHIESDVDISQCPHREITLISLPSLLTLEFNLWLYYDLHVGQVQCICMCKKGSSKLQSHLRTCQCI